MEQEVEQEVKEEEKEEEKPTPTTCEDDAPEKSAEPTEQEKQDEPPPTEVKRSAQGFYFLCAVSRSVKCFDTRFTFMLLCSEAFDGFIDSTNSNFFASWL